VPLRCAVIVLASSHLRLCDPLIFCCAVLLLLLLPGGCLRVFGPVALVATPILDCLHRQLHLNFALGAEFGQQDSASQSSHSLSTTDMGYVSLQHIYIHR
jgi:hypothetical protein